MSVHSNRITTPWFETRLVGKVRLKYRPNKNFRTGFRWSSDSKEDMFLHKHTRQSSTQNNKYKVLHKHSCFSWWRAHSRPKHVEIDNILRINCAPSWLYLQDYTGMYGQLNIKHKIRKYLSVFKSMWTKMLREYSLLNGFVKLRVIKPVQLNKPVRVLISSLCAGSWLALWRTRGVGIAKRTVEGQRLTAANQLCPKTFVLDCVWNAMAHAENPQFVFRRNGRVHLNRQGRQFSRLLAAEVCASAVVMLDTPSFEVVKGTGYPLNSPVSPSLPLPCVTVCHHISTGLFVSEAFLRS